MIELPKNEYTFTFEHVGQETNNKYDGVFTVLCSLPIKKRHELELEKTRLCADFQNPTPGLYGLATILSTLKTYIVKAPSWWNDSNNGSELLDEDVIAALYKKIDEAKAQWKEKIMKNGMESEKDAQ